MNREFSGWLKSQERLASDGARSLLPANAQTSLLRRLQVMFNSGIPLTDCIWSLKEQEADPAVGEMLGKLLDSVSSGSPLSVALSRQKLRFPKRVLASIRLGESSGQLAHVLNDLADGVEREADLSKRVKSALTYPCLLALGAFLAMLGMFVFFIPQLIEFSQSVKGSVSPIVGTLFSVAEVLCNPAVVFGILQTLAAVIFVGYCFLKTSDGKMKWSRFLLTAPVIGPVFQQVAVLRFAHAFKLLVRSGFPLAKALDLLAQTTENPVLKEEIRAARSAIIHGADLSEAFQVGTCFDSSFIAFLEVGQSSGRLERMLEAIIYLRTVDLESKIEAAVSLIEPLILSILGVAVALVTLIFFLPMAQMVQLL